MIVLFALFGLLVGGLVNQLGSDLPAFAVSRSREQGSPGGLPGSLASDPPVRRRLTRPHCPRCDQDRPWWQWLTLPSYLVGRARCPHCDTRISLRYYGTPTRWQEIYQANRELLSEANALRPGQRLRIP